MKAPNLNQIIRAFKKEDKRLGALAEAEEDGHPFIICTNCAKWLRDNFFPGSTILGYYSEDNETALLGSYVGGHDFLLIEGRYIIDLWPRYIEQEKTVPVFFDTKTNPELVAKYYGDKTKWKFVC